MLRLAKGSRSEHNLTFDNLGRRLVCEPFEGHAHGAIEVGVGRLAKHPSADVQRGHDRSISTMRFSGASGPTAA
jgi:hypothetical protein